MRAIVVVDVAVVVVVVVVVVAVVSAAFLHLPTNSTVTHAIELTYL